MRIEPVEVLFKGGRLLNVFTGRIQELDIAVDKGRIVGWNGYTGRKVVDLHGMYVLPGFIDAHLHIESTLLTPSEFAKAVLPTGTTTVIADPHEIANVMGIDGIRYMLEASRSVPLNIFFMLPSCVPSSPLETAGARLGAEDLRPLLDEERIIGLAEVMDVEGVLGGRKDIIEKLRLFGDRPVNGHAPSLTGRDLNRYISYGIHTDHESTSFAEGMEKVEKGMFLMIREGTTAKDLEALLPLIGEGLERRLAFVSDDRDPMDLCREGHINSILRKAIKSGIDPFTAVRMVTINPAQHYGLKDLGAIAPGYRADMVVLPDLEGFNPYMVIKDGRVVVKGGNVLWDGESPPLVWKGMKTVLGDIRIEARGEYIRVIEVSPWTILTKARIEKGKVEDGWVVSDPERDLLKVVVFERHRGTGNRGIGFVKGFNLKEGAIASSVAHDAHNLVALGVDDEDILLAARKVREMNGGLVVVAKGRLLASLPLPVAGLMSPKPLKEIVDALEILLSTTRKLGSSLPNPFMALSFISLPVVPELRVTDKGLVDVERGKVVSPFVDEN